jgi:LemA protein
MNLRNLGILAVVAVLFFWGCNVRNGLATSDLGIKKAWSEVENNYQRRNDLIDNLMATVEGAAGFEKSTLTEIAEARASANRVKIDASNMTSEGLQQFQAAQGNLGLAAGRMMNMVTENYPQLRATEQFQKFSDELAGTENRMANVRRDFNTSVQDYNAKLITFPSNLIAGVTGFKEKPYFQADAGASKAPTVKFSTSQGATPPATPNTSGQPAPSGQPQPGGSH